MGTPNGSLGGIAVVPEINYGVTPITPDWKWQHPMAGGLGNRREIITPNLLSYAAQTCRKYSVVFSDGELNVGLNLEKAIIGNILGLVGSEQSNVFKLGDGSVPAVRSLSVLDSYGGGGSAPEDNLEYIFPGIKADALRFEIVADSNSKLTIVTIGQKGEKTADGSASTPNPPTECDVVMPSDIGVVTVGVGEAWETVVCLHSATIEVSTPHTGSGWRCLNGNMKEPIINARPQVTFSLALDLDDETDNNTVALLEAFNAGLVIGDVTFGSSFLLKDTMMSGDFPSKSEGLIEFNLSGQASYFQVTTT